jgi:hypothetical protein
MRIVCGWEISHGQIGTELVRGATVLEEVCRGKVYYLGPGAPTGLTVYRQALIEWRQIQADLAEKAAAAKGADETKSLVEKHTADYAMVQTIRAMAKGGTKSMSRAENLRHYLHKFTQWQESPNLPPAGNRPAIDIGASLVRGYFSYLLEKVTSGALATATACSTLMAFKQFVRHLWQDDVIGLPRNLGDRNLRIQVPAKAVTTYTIDQVKALLATAQAQTKLHCLLCLNTGMTAKDISDLHPSEVNWAAGAITRKRSKTKKIASSAESVGDLWLGQAASW